MAELTTPTADSADGTSANEQDEWPDWQIHQRTAAQLARYVSASHAASWVPRDLLSPLRGKAAAGLRRDRPARLYQALTARRIPYASAPWSPAAYDTAGHLAYQRIRTPAETLQGPATCLDLVLTFAGMAAEADLRPLIAIRYHPAPHALVVLELSGGMSEPTDYDRWPVPPGFTQRPGEPGVWDQADPLDRPLVQLAQAPDWLPVEVVGVTRDYDAEYPRASGLTAAAELAAEEAAESQESHWTLVDVRRVLIALNAMGIAPFEPPDGGPRPAIHSYLPAFPDFRHFPTRSGIVRQLQDLIDAGDPATLVIQAPSGYGKSMLAHRLAAGADHGCGWFLNATDARELRRSLAQAERSEHELGGEPSRPNGEKADAVDDQAFAAAALDRLRAAERPWVVVVDNCDSAPDAELRDLLPKPHAAGQVVIVTTTHPGWLDYAAGASHRVQLAGLAESDLRDLRLPTDLSASVDGRPLIALALAALRDRAGAVLPASTGQDGPGLVWDLLRSSARAGQKVVELARFLAWLPPEPMPEQALGKIAVLDASPGDTLAELRFVTHSVSAVPGLWADPADVGSPGLLMHRLFSAAVREQTWRDAPDAAADVIARLLTTDQGRWLFITAADATALARLKRGDYPDKPEPGDAELAVRLLCERPEPGRPAPGLLWHGLGHIRERRGPVLASREPFARAVETLDPASYPYEVAESKIGLARVIFQDGRSTDAGLEAARDMAREAQSLLASLAHKEARQLREQGNALSWLIAQKLAAGEPDLAVREARLSEARDNLWSSFAQRLRIARELGDDEPVGDDAIPVLDDELGPERAFYNLAGVTIQLAKTRHQLAALTAGGSGRKLQIGDDRLRPAEESLREAERVYDVVRELREQRYGGRPHPHLAACLHGLAITGYYRAALLGQAGELADAERNAAAALDQRLRIAGSLVGPGTSAALRDPDVGKSVDLVLKIMTASVLTRFGDLVSGSDAVVKVLREAIGEWMDGPGRTPAEEAGDSNGSPAVLGYEHEVHVQLPADVPTGFGGAMVPGLVRRALARIGPLAKVAGDIEVVRVRPSEPDEIRASGSLDVGLALSAPVGQQMDAALRWMIANAIRTPDPSWWPESGSPGEPQPASAQDAAACHADPPSNETSPSDAGGRAVTEDRPDFPGPGGFIEAPRRRPRYLSASYPDTVQPGRRFSLEAAVVLSRGAGRAEQLLRNFEVGLRGKRLLLTIYAPRLTVHGDHQRSVLVPAEGNSDPVRFDLEGGTTGVHQIRLRAWDGGSCVGELQAEVTISDHAPGGTGRTLAREMEAEAAPGEITLEVISEVINGQNRYSFQLQDPVTAPAPALLPLRQDPAADLEALILRMDALAEDPGKYTRGQIYRALCKEGRQLWQDLVPPAVQQQFWQCRHRIGQLTIIADDDAFPWELLYPWDNVNDAGFLVEQFPVTRRVHGFPRRRLLRRRPARFVLRGSTLPRAEGEVNALKQLFQSPEPTISTLQELQELIDDGAFGVLHFACHGSFTRSDRGPQIELDLPFMPRELVDAGMTWQSPLVFLNACRSAGPRQRCTGLDSFAERFIRANAGAFIGSLWEVRDSTAAKFAQELYQNLLSGQPLGHAITDLRKKAKDGDPTWLAYAVYGDPQARLA